MGNATKHAKKYLKVLSVFLFICLNSCVKHSSVDQFPQWMLGDWYHEGRKFNILEHWEVSKDKTCYVGETIWNYPDQKSYENLKIYLKDDTLNYSVEINSKTTVFKTADFKGDTLRFENKTNDFPKYLYYAKIKEDKNICWIENYKSDPNKQVYVFHKTAKK